MGENMYKKCYSTTKKLTQNKKKTLMPLYIGLRERLLKVSVKKKEKLFHTYPEMIIYISRKNSVVVIRSLQIRWSLICLLSIFFLEALLVTGIRLLAFWLQKCHEGLDNSQRSISEWHQNQDLHNGKLLIKVKFYSFINPENTH